MVALDRHRRCPQRVRGHLPAEQRMPPAAWLRRVPGAEDVAVDALQLENGQQPFDRRSARGVGGHRRVLLHASPLSVSGSRGSPSSRSAIWLRSTSDVPPSIVLARARRKLCARASAAESPGIQATPPRPAASTAASLRRWLSSALKTFPTPPSGPG